MIESISFDNYEMKLDPKESYPLQLINKTTSEVLHLTIDEAVGLLKVLYKHRFTQPNSLAHE